MTAGILNYINTKDGLYKTLLQTDINSGDYRAARPILSVTETYCAIVVKGQKCCIIREHLSFIKMI